jgi:hypothetical protein
MPCTSKRQTKKNKLKENKKHPYNTRRKLLMAKKKAKKKKKK